MIDKRVYISWVIVSFFLILSLSPVFIFGPEAEAGNSTMPMNNSSRGLPNDEWPAFRGDAARTGNTTGTGPGYFYQLWSASSVSFWGSPVAMYDQIYILYKNVFGGGTGTTKCYNLTGGLQWTYNVGNGYGSPLVYNGRVYIAGFNGDLYCLDANATGSGTTTMYWTYNPTGVTNAASSPVTDGTKIYYSTQHASGLHAVWITNGSKAWNASLGGSTATESSPAYWNGRVYCGGGDSYDTGTNDLYCYNATNGNLFWKFATGNDVVSTPAVEYGRVYFGSMDAKVYCVDAVGSGGTTTKYWEYNTFAGSQGVYGSASVAYGRVYIGATNSHLYCFDAYGSSGTTTVYWDKTITTAGQWGICASPAVTPDYVFVGNSGNVMHCRDRATGDEVWSHTFPAATYGLSSAVVYKDMLFVASDNFNLYAMGPDLIPPKIESSNPADLTVDIDPYQNITVEFDKELALSTLTTANLILKDSQDATVAGTITADMNTFKVYFTPSSHLLKDETYTYTVTTDVTDLHDNKLDGNKNGIFDGIGVDEYKFSFTTVPNFPPVISAIPTQKPTEDKQLTLNLNSKISDADTANDQLILSENSSYATLDGYLLKMLYPNGVLSDSINLTVDDGLFTTYKHIDVLVTPENDPPTMTTIPILKLTEDVTYSLDMTEYVTDVDTPYSGLGMYSRSKNIDLDGMLINFTYPNGVIDDVVNVTIDDGEYFIYVDIEVEIEPVNDPPTIAVIPMIQAEEDTPYSFPIESYISDIDTPKGSLEVIVDSPYVDVSGHTLNFLYPDGVWSDTLEIKVYDGEYYVNSTLEVLVDPVNDIPVVLALVSPQEDDEFEHNETFELEVDVFDDDLKYGDELSFKWFDNVEGKIADTQNATDISLSPGKHMISFQVSDKSGGKANAYVNITVKEAPKPDPKPDPNITDNKTDDKKEPKKEEASFDFGLFSILAIIIIVVVVAILVGLLLMRRRKKPEETGEGAMMPPQVAPVPPDQAQVQPQGQVPPQAEMPMQPYQQYPGQPLDPGMQQQGQMYPQQTPMGYDQPQMYPQQYPDQMQYQDASQPYNYQQYPDQQQQQMGMDTYQQYPDQTMVQESPQPYNYDQYPEQQQQPGLDTTLDTSPNTSLYSPEAVPELPPGPPSDGTDGQAPGTTHSLPMPKLPDPDQTQE